MRYARDTDVSIEKSKAEIETIIRRYGATGFVSGWRADVAVISFEMTDRRIRFNLPLPSRNADEFTKRRVNQHGVTGNRAPDAAYAAWEKACRQRWRAMALAIKAKLEAVESGIFTFEEEFLSHVVLPTGMTIGETLMPSLPQICATGKLPPLLPAPKS